MTGGVPINCIMEINVGISDTQIRLAQSAYRQWVLKRFGMNQSQSVITLFENHNLVSYLGKPNNNGKYQTIMASLVYAVGGTRLDIAYATTFLAIFPFRPVPEHWIAAERVLRGVKGTQNYGLIYLPTIKQAIKVLGYTHASYTSDISDRHSYSRQCFLINNCLVSWKTKRQCSVAIQLAKPNIRHSQSHFSNMFEWDREWSNKKLRHISNFWETTIEEISLAKNPVSHSQSKCREVHHHSVQEKFNEILFCLNYMSTTDNLADVFANGPEKTKYHLCSSKIDCNSLGEVLK